MTMTHDDDDDGIILPALADDLELVAALCKRQSFSPCQWPFEIQCHIPKEQDAVLTTFLSLPKI